MYIHVDSQDHKNIAGIAYLQTKLQELYPALKVDGMLGTETVLAFRSSIKQAFDIPKQGFDLEGVGIAAIQSLIMQAVKATGPAKFATAGLHDGLWGKDTKGAIDYILDPLLVAARVKELTEFVAGKPRLATKLSPRILADVRNRVKPTAGSLVPMTFEGSGVPKQGTHWCSGMEYEVNEQTNSLLAKIMDHENPAVTIHQMLAASYQIALEYYKGRAVGIILVRPYCSIPMNKSDDPIPCFMITGIYVKKSIRNAGIGTRLLCAVKFRGQEMNIQRIEFIRGAAVLSLTETLEGKRTVKERIFDQLVNGHGYRQVASGLDIGRPERCVLDL